MMMARILLVLMAWTLQASLVLLLVSASWIRSQAAEERHASTQALGTARSEEIETSAHALYERWFVRTGIIERSYRELLPQHREPASGMDNLAPWFFRWMRERIDGFWELTYQAIYRLHVLRCWTGLILLGIGCAMLDGLLRRRIRRADQRMASADRYLLTRHALLALLFLPLFYLSSPFAISGTAIPIWGAFLSAALWTLTTHAQQHI